MVQFHLLLEPPATRSHGKLANARSTIFGFVLIPKRTPFLHRIDMRANNEVPIHFTPVGSTDKLKANSVDLKINMCTGTYNFCFGKSLRDITYTDSSLVENALNFI